MTAECFLDTNVLVYAAIGHESDPLKYARAKELLTANYGTSAQVLQEFYVNVTRKADRPLTAEKAAEWIGELTLRPCHPIDSSIVLRGIEHAQRYGISYWDGAIVAATEGLGVTTLYTEDLNHGQLYASVRAINPFLEH